jgi:hypothetical protein
MMKHFAFKFQFSNISISNSIFHFVNKFNARHHIADIFCSFLNFAEFKELENSAEIVNILQHICIKI